MTTYSGSQIFPGLSSRQTKSLEAALRLAPGDYREGLLRNIYSLLGVADSYTHTALISACEQAFAGEGMPPGFDLSDRYYLFGDTLGVLAAGGNTSAKLVQRQAAPTALGATGALSANLT